MNVIVFPSSKPEKLPFEAVYDRYYQETVYYVMGKLGNYHDAEDLAGEAFFYCYLNYEKYDPEKSSVATWLYLIVNSRLKNYYRDHKEHVDYTDLENQLFDEDLDMDKAVYLEELREFLSENLLQLPEKQRKAVILRYFHEKEYSAIAQELGVTEGNARVMISRALDKMGKEINKAAADWRLS